MNNSLTSSFNPPLRIPPSHAGELAKRPHGNSNENPIGCITFAEAIAGVRLIPLTQGKTAIVDSDDYEAITDRRWHYGSNGYAIRKHLGKKAGKDRMHIRIASTPEGMLTDHINCNRLDNRRCNLRVCTPAQNRMNSKTKRAAASGYKGVSVLKASGRFRAYVTQHGKASHIGVYDTPQAAAEARDRAACKMHGEFFRASLTCPNHSINENQS